MQVRLEDVIIAIEQTDIEHQFHYYIPEERIVFFDDSDDEEYLEAFNNDELIALPSSSQKQDYKMMQDFIKEKTYGEAKEWLIEAIKGTGAFRRFRSTLDRFNITNIWYEYRDQAYEKLAIDWCNYHGIEYYEDIPHEKAEVDEEEIKVIPKKENDYRLIQINKDNYYGLVYLVKDFRKTLANLKGYKTSFDEDDALDELHYYLDNNYPIYVISEGGKFIAYCVCKIIEDCVWLESIYVLPEKRRKGVARLLLDKAQEIAQEYHNDTLYINVHPNNDNMLYFLKANGYDVLNMIEIRKKSSDENLSTTYQIGEHEYKY